MKNKPKAVSSLYFSTPYREMQLSTAELISNQGYQRKIRHHAVQKIVNGYDPKLLDPIVVSQRNGHFYVVDGQHRISALRILNGGHDCFVSCRVIFGLTYEQEAELYERLDESNNKLNIVDSTRAKSESGKDPTIEGIKSILDENHIDWLTENKGNNGNSKTKATRELLNAYRRLGQARFAQMIRLTVETWHGDKDSLTMFIIAGMALFTEVYSPEINEAEFVKKLSLISPKEIITQGRADVSTSKMGLRYARVILSNYNRKRRTGTLKYKLEG